MIYMAKQRTCITIDEDLLISAKKKGIKVSQVTEAALLRELEAYEKNNYMKALEHLQNTLKQFLDYKGLRGEFDDWRLRDLK